MAMITCPECGKEISNKAQICPNCGAPVEKEGLLMEGGFEPASTPLIGERAQTTYHGDDTTIKSVIEKITELFRKARLIAALGAVLFLIFLLIICGSIKKQISKKLTSTEQYYTGISDKGVGTQTGQGIRPEFKEAMDSYEAFFDEYVDFMKKYSASNDIVSLMNDYTNYMLKYSQAMEDMEKLKDESMNDAELNYYIEVTARIEKKLLQVSAQMY